MKIYKIDCEWDVGQEGKTFSSKEKAEKWLEAIDWEALVEDNLENIKKDGLVSIEEVTLD